MDFRFTPITEPEARIVLDWRYPDIGTLYDPDPDELEDDIACMLLNVSNVIGSDDWTKKLLEDLKQGNLSDE